MRESIIQIVDNSGVLYAKIIKTRNLKKNNVEWGSIAVVFPEKSSVFTLRKKKYWCLILSLKKLNRRKSGTSIRSFDNRGILVQENSFKFLGTRVYGPLCYELRNSKQKKSRYKKIISYSHGVI